MFGLSVEDVSQKLREDFGLEIAPRSIYSYESGHRQPDADILMSLCALYKISDVVGEFSELETKKDPPPEVSGTGEDINATELLIQFCRKMGWLGENGDITAEQADALISIIDLLEIIFKSKK